MPHGGTDGSSGNATPLDVIAAAHADGFLAADAWDMPTLRARAARFRVAFDQIDRR